MTDTKFCELSSLVLVDILAALPMEHVVRMARLGHERLRQTCSLKWVKDRMTDVTFEEILRAYQLRGDIAAIFCLSSVMKRLNGEVKMRRISFDNYDLIEDYIELVKQVPGKLHLRFEDVQVESEEADDQYERIESALGALPNLIYTSHTIARETNPIDVIQRCPGMVFDYCYRPDEGCHFVYYRPALLNGRYVVDVLRTVCGPADVSEAELDRVRGEAMEWSEDLEYLDEWYEGVWSTEWWGAAIAVRV